MHKRIPALAACGAALALALPAAASAGALAVDRPCYTHIPDGSGATQPVVVTVAGGTPGAGFLVSAGYATADGGAGSASGTFNAAGVGRTSLGGVFTRTLLDPVRGEVVHLLVHDYGSGTDIATGTATVTNAAIKVAAKPKNPYRKRVLTVSGLTPLFGAGALYGSYVSGYNGKKVVKVVKLGRPNACGYLRVKRVLPPRHGFHKWALYVHVGRKLDKAKSLKYPFKVYKIFG